MAGGGPRGGGRRGGGKRGAGGALRAPNALTSVALVLPVLILYEAGILFTGTINGADLVTRTLLWWLGRQGFLWAQLGLLLSMVAALLYLRRRERIDLARFLPVLLESGIYALTMGSFIIFVMVDLLGISPGLATGSGGIAQASLYERLVLSLGAGIHEELVFRLILLNLFAAAGRGLLGLKPAASLAAAVALSSLLFSAAHHIGPLGEPLRAGVFIYRTLAGVVFALIYRYRSFAIAVYSHALYDIYVLLLR